MRYFTSITPYHIDKNFDLIQYWAMNNELIGCTDGLASDGTGGHVYGVTSRTSSQMIIEGYT